MKNQTQKEILNFILAIAILLTFLALLGIYLLFTVEAVGEVVNY